MMPPMLDSQPLRPYLDAVRTTRAARHAVVTTRDAWPEPHTMEQTTSFKRDYREADQAHTDACERLARQVGDSDTWWEAAEGEGGMTCSP